MISYAHKYWQTHNVQLCLTSFTFPFSEKMCVIKFILPFTKELDIDIELLFIVDAKILIWQDIGNGITIITYQT